MRRLEGWAVAGELQKAVGRLGELLRADVTLARASVSPTPPSTAVPVHGVMVMTMTLCGGAVRLELHLTQSLALALAQGALRVPIGEPARRLTMGEEGALLFALAAAIPGATVDLAPANGRRPDVLAVADVAVRFASTPIPVRGTLSVGLDTDLPMASPAAGALLAPVLEQHAVLRLRTARCLLAQSQLSALRCRDVLVVGPRRPTLDAGGSPAFECSVDQGEVAVRIERVLVLYRKDLEVRMPQKEEVADAGADTVRAAEVEVVVELGRAHIPVGRMLELTLGSVITLDRPPSQLAELYAGGQLLGRGELVDVDGEVGVRLTELASR
jgi:flagellar motor switch/type III secretory pathway protein FliN